MVSIDEIEKAIVFDSTLKFKNKFSTHLKNKYIKPQLYSREKLYDNMFAGKTIIFKNYPLKLIKGLDENNPDILIRMLKEGLPQKEKISIRSGLSRSLNKVTINDVIERWLRQKSRFGVTDLHFRETKFYDNIDAQAICYFNLLPHCPDDVSFLEMLTLVISSKGIFSDSHSDDGDGSNHCFVGKKLWLAWDRIEGQKNGLQDCSFDCVYDQAKFDMNKFASLKSSHWFIVSDNQTLFMPGNFTHKVITLEPYIGFGSFYVSLPNYFNTLKRWILYESGDVKGEFLNIMNVHSLHKIKEIAKLSNAFQEKWGLKYLNKAAKNWKKGLNSSQILKLSNNDAFKEALHFSKFI